MNGDGNTDLVAVKIDSVTVLLANELTSACTRIHHFQRDLALTN
jgi:hypothetical protein